MNNRQERRGGRLAAALALCVCTILSYHVSGTVKVFANNSNSGMGHLIPRPASITPAEGAFILSTASQIVVEANNPELVAVGHFLAENLRPATGYPLPLVEAAGAAEPGNIMLTTGGDAALGDEGYVLTVTPDAVTLAAYQPAGAFWGVQTLRQLLPPEIERSTLQPGPWTIPAGTIRDLPRFAWRGAMLDVARHFFGVEDVKRYIDLLAYYKLNRLHLHLSDDQGWRIMINAWPRLVEVGGSTGVGGGAGGYYTQAEYADLITYAQARYITVIPEIDMPGHTNAALASYPELNCNGQTPALYTGIEVGFSSLCIDKDITYTFVDDVIKELAALTPGPYLHIGGDEALSTPKADYMQFLTRVQTIVQAHGKQMIGWEEIAQIDLLDTSIAQHWHSDMARTAAAQGAKVIVSPASKAYLDMKYDPSTPLGLNWAGTTSVQDGYDWDPASQVNGVGEADILGVEAPLWAETIQTLDEIEFLAFPRLCGIAEIGWSPAAGRSWDEYKVRLGAHGPRLAALGVNFYTAPEVPWQ